MGTVRALPATEAYAAQPGALPMQAAQVWARGFHARQCKHDENNGEAGPAAPQAGRARASHRNGWGGCGFVEFWAGTRASAQNVRPATNSQTMSTDVLEVVNVTEDGGIVKEILARGEPDAFPSSGDEVSGAWRAAPLPDYPAFERALRDSSVSPLVCPSTPVPQPTTRVHCWMARSLTAPGIGARHSRCVRPRRNRIQPRGSQACVLRPSAVHPGPGAGYQGLGSWVCHHDPRREGGPHLPGCVSEARSTLCLVPCVTWLLPPFSRCAGTPMVSGAPLPRFLRTRRCGLRWSCSASSRRRRRSGS